MPTITYVEHSGAHHIVEVPDGVSLMEGALQNNVPGIDGDCGGNAVCATCHIYVGEGWEAKTGSRSEQEEAMLDLASDVHANSRLACQIVASGELDGLVVRMPATQH